jgi:hypothetical protein
VTTKKTFKELRALLRDLEDQAQGADNDWLLYDLIRLKTQIQSEIDALRYERITNANELLKKLNL